MSKTFSSIALTLSFLSPLALAACAQSEEAGYDASGSADSESIETAPANSPEGNVDPDGAGPDEAYGESGNVNPVTTEVPETGEVADISGEGDDTRIADD